MKKKTVIMIGVIVALIIAAIGGGVAVSGILNPYEKQIKLGYKMLEEEKYDEAILAFNSAIEIDERKPKAYVGLKDVYITKCDENTVQDTSDALKIGYEKSQSEQIVQAYIDGAQSLFDKDKQEWSIKLLEDGDEVTSNQRIKDKLEELLKIIRNSFLQKIYSLCEKDNLDEVRKIMESDEFTSIAGKATADNPIIFYPNNEKEKGVGIYIADSEYYIYFGDYNNNIRSDEGIWLNPDYLYRGSWNNDKPNGNGVSYEGKSEHEACRITGNVIDGLWNETINHTDVYKGEEHLYEIVQYDNGKILSVQFGNEGGEAQEVLSREQFFKQMDEEQALVTDDGEAVPIEEPHGILGFAKQGWI